MKGKRHLNIPTTKEEMVIFDLEQGQSMGRQIAELLDIPLGDYELRRFDMGEHKIRPLVNVRNRDVYVINSLFGDKRDSVNDKLCRLLFFLGALRDAAAGRITVVAPYLCYSRKDRKTKARDPVTTKYVARLFDAMGIDAFMTMDIHNLQAFQNSFRCLTEHLEGKNLFVEYFSNQLKGESIMVMSPDFGGAKRAEQFRQALEEAMENKVGFGLTEKSRSKDIVKGDKVTGEIEGKSIILIDDLISSGGTLFRAAETCQQRGAKAVYAVATHGTFSQDAHLNLDQKAFKEIVITDTISHLSLDPELVQKKIKVISAAPLLAKAILCIHTGDSIVNLLGHE